MKLGPKLSRRLAIGGGVAALGGGAALLLRASPGSGLMGPFTDGKTLHRGNGAEPETLDPHRATGIWEDNIIGDLFLGLMTQNAAADPSFGAAESYEKSADGLTYTFKLRKASWSDGVALTADDFVYSFRRAAALGAHPQAGAQYAILDPIANMREAIARKVPPEAIGVSAPDPATLEIRFRFQVPYAAELLMHRMSFAVPRHVVEKHGEQWSKPGNIVTNGPYILDAWVPNDHVRLKKNPRFYAADQVAIETILFTPEENGDPAARFRAGALDVATGGVPPEAAATLEKTVGGALKVWPYIETYYLAFNVRRKPFDDVRVRTALAIAIDRERLAARLPHAGQKPAYGIVPPGMPDYPYSAALASHLLPMEVRLARARGLLAAAGFGPQKPLRVDFAVYNSAEWKIDAVALHAMWRRIGVEVRILPIDTRILYDMMRSHDFAVASAGWAADYRDPKNYLSLFASGAGALNYGSYSNPKFDDLLDRSDVISEAKTRMQMLAEAEQILLDDCAAAPVYFSASRNLVSPQVKGWVSNVSNINRSRFLSLDRSVASG